MISLVLDPRGRGWFRGDRAGGWQSPGSGVWERSERQVLLVLVPQGVDGPVQVVDRHLGAVRASVSRSRA